MSNMSKRTSVLSALAAALTFTVAIPAFAQAPTDAQRSEIRSACRSDYMAHCSSVPPGGMESLQCLQKNMSSLSSGCQSAVRAIEPAAEPKAEAKPEAEPEAKPVPKAETKPEAEPAPAATAAPAEKPAAETAAPATKSAESPAASPPKKPSSAQAAITIPAKATCFPFLMESPLSGSADTCPIVTEIRRSPPACPQLPN